MEGNTYRTIVFEKFNNEAPDLKTKLTGASTTERVYGDVANELTVHSFKEFLEKFSPDIYEVPVSRTNIEYRLEKPAGMDIQPLKITEHAYYRMLEQCYEQKGTSGQSNLQFDDKAILEMLMPEAEVQEARNLRKLIKEDFRKIQQAMKTGESAAPYKERLQSSLDKVNRTIRGSIVGMLPLAIEDSERKIQVFDKQLTAADASPDGMVPALTAGRQDFDKNGRITFREIEAPTAEAVPELQQSGPTIAGLLEADYRHEMGDEETYAKKLLISVYAATDSAQGSNALVDISQIKESKREETEKLLEYQTVYKNARASFIDTMSAVVGKLLGIKVLFDHATAKGGMNGYLADGILIANSTITDLTASGVKDSFQRFMKWIGKDQVEKKIWFAVVPNVADQYAAGDGTEEDGGAQREKFDLGGFFSEGGEAPKQEKKPQPSDSPSLMQLRQAIAILGEAKIMTFFSFRGNDKNGFGTITAEYINEHKKWFDGMKGADHASYAYPNFTVVRERTIPLATKEQQQRFQEIGVVDDAMKLHVSAVYIDAAYPAAGLMIASQQKDILRAKGLSVDMTLPCVRVNPATSELKPYLTTKFNRENMLQWSADIVDAIKKDGFGFAFSSDALKVGDKRLENTYVLCANTLAKDDEYRYVPVEHKMLEDYIWCEYQESTQTVSELERLVSRLNREWHSAARHPENVNLMLRNENETIAFEMEEGAKPKIHIKLDKADVYVDNLDVTVE